MRLIPAVCDDDIDPVPRRTGKDRLRTLDSLDQRTKAARLAARLVADLENDLGGGALLTTAQRELTKRAALLGAMVEDAEVNWLERKPADLDLYGTLVDRQRRILEALGLDRKPRNVNQRRDVTGEVIARLEGGGH